MKQRIRPYQLVIGLGRRARAVRHRIRHRPALHRLARRRRPRSARSSATSRARGSWSSTWSPGAVRLRRVLVLHAGQELGAGQARQPGHHAKNAKRRLKDFRAGVYMQTLLRDPAAGIMHSLIYFCFLSCSPSPPCSRSTTSCPRSWKFLHGQVYQALLVRRRRGRARVPASASRGRSSAATCSGRTASASRPSPSTR